MEILGEYRDNKNRTFVAILYPDYEETFLGIFWQKPTHDHLSVPNFVPVVVPWNISGQDKVERFQVILQRISCESLKILPIELDLNDMSTVALDWIMSNLKV